MGITSLAYFLFFPLAATVYFWVPKRLQNFSLLLFSCIFYCVNLPADGTVFTKCLPVAVLIFETLFVWRLALAISKAGGRSKIALEWFGIAVCLGLLAFFKYFNFFASSIPAFTGIAKLALPLGISFYTFTAVGYLIDTARGTATAEEKFCNVAVFLCFFGTVTSGPICRAGAFLPQLHTPRFFNRATAVTALRLALQGFFKQIAVANILGFYVNFIFGNLAAYSGFTLIFSAAMYALQLYFEFSGYSDLAKASALFLGIEIPANFNTPYFATNFSGFWQRWHISLSSWLQDYLFTPLIWARWQERLPLIGRFFTGPPVLFSLFCVFFVSGFWHGNTLPFVVWGLLQACYRIGEELLHRTFGKPKKRQKAYSVLAKRAGVFTLWAASLVFFRVGYLKGGTVGSAAASLARWFNGLSFSVFLSETAGAISKGFYAKPVMVAAYCAYMALVFAIAFFMEWYQFNKNGGSPAIFALQKARPAVRWACYYTLILFVLVGFILQSGGFGSMGMAYQGF